MIKKTLLALSLMGLIVASVPSSAVAGPTAGGYATDNVEYAGYVPFEVGTSTGVSIIGKYMYQTSWKNISIYDISDPTSPQLLDWEPFGFKFENEDVEVDPRGKILLFSEQLPSNILHIYDIEDKSNIQKLAELPGGGGHTASCILKCKWAYTTTGAIVDLRDPANPKLVEGADWRKLIGMEGGVHDITEFRNGFFTTSPYADPVFVVDARNPLKPKTIAAAPHPDAANWIIHSVGWPRGGKDRIMLAQGEKNFRPQCQDTQGPFFTYVTKGFKGKSFKIADFYKVENGTYQDGGPPSNALGCSAHWFTEHPKFKNGGLVAVGYYEHGTRILDIKSNGKIEEAGYFIPWGGSTSAAYWVNKDIIYAVDYTRGIDILKFNQK